LSTIDASPVHIFVPYSLNLLLSLLIHLSSDVLEGIRGCTRMYINIPYITTRSVVSDLLISNSTLLSINHLS
jgi:hypothetical protein